jgi:cobalt-zinc-cadmium efflux system protein
MAPPPAHSHPHARGHDGHGHDHGHGNHGHDHDAGPGLRLIHASYGKLLTGFWIITAFMGVEILCGWLFHSLALLSDGVHMLSDAVSLGLSAFAVSLGARRATGEKTFGFKRFEILAAFGNGLTLALVSALIAAQAVVRLWHPVPVEAKSMLGVAAAGLLVNVIAAWWLHRGGHEKTINEESAFQHVLGDLGASLAAVAAGVLILLKGWLWADPVLSLAIAGAMAIAGVRVMRRSGHILVEGVPEGIAIEDVRRAMLAHPQVRQVHDLHVWTMNGRDSYLSAHLDVAPGELAEKEVVARLGRALGRDFGMDHLTLQAGQCAEGDCFNNCEGPAPLPDISAKKAGTARAQ